MAIVPIGNLSLQVPESDSSEFILELIKRIQGSMQDIVPRMIETSLEAEVERILMRKSYVRRRKSRSKPSEAYCNTCHSRQRGQFMRNGHYRRMLTTQWGQIVLNMPQLACECGGHVHMEFQSVRPRQRVWDDVKLKIQVEYERGLSYRRIKQELDDQLQSSVGLRTLNQCVLAFGKQDRWVQTWQKGEAPPVVRMDGIWVTVMLESDTRQTDAAGRERPVKYAKKLPILAAQGVWPTTGKTQLIGWMRGEAEDQASWVKFMEALYQDGLTQENGLALFASDGGAGFRTAYESIYWKTPLQRCVFHKLRNMARALQPPAGMDRPTFHTYATEFLRSAARIWQADEVIEAQLRFTAFCQQWLGAQPKAIKTLCNDFDDTLSFYAVQEQAALHGEIWPSHLLRTTSPLERMFREFRHRYRNAVLFHSTTGLQATTAQLAHHFS